MPRLKNPAPFVVYVTYPGNSKEYAYLCDIPDIKQGDEVLGNNAARTRVVRTANSDPLAVRWVAPVPNHSEATRLARKTQIVARLRTLQAEQSQLELWQKLSTKNPEAKKLYTELKLLLKHS